MSGKSPRARYRVRTDELARLCGCESQTELIDALRQSGQEFSAQGVFRHKGSQAERREDAKALRDWFSQQDLPKDPPLVNVAVVSTASRPGPLDSPSKPKALLKVGDATLLTHCLRGICRAGVRHVVLVLGGPTSEAISRHLSDMEWTSYFQSLRIVDLGSTYSSGHASSLLAAARVLLGSQKPRPFLLVGVDHVYHHDILRKLVENGTEGSAGVVLVETDRDVISRMRLNTHNTTVRVIVGDDFLIDQETATHSDEAYFFASPSLNDHAGFSLMKDAYGDRRSDEDDDDDDDDDEKNDAVYDTHDSSFSSSSSWVRQIGRDLHAYNGIEAGAFVLSTRVFDAMRGLARAEPYFTLAEALSKFCVQNAPSQLRAAHTGGRPWIAIESAEQRIQNSGSDLFKFRRRVEDDAAAGSLWKRYLGVALHVEVVPESRRTGIFDMIHDEDHAVGVVELKSESMEQQFLKAAKNEQDKISRDEKVLKYSEQQQWTRARKISSSSLASLFESYQDEEEEEEDDEDFEDNTGILVANTDAGRGAFAVFEHDDATDRQDATMAPSTAIEEGAPNYEIKNLKRRRLVPPNDVERIRVRLFTSFDDTEPPKLAVRLERKVPLIGWIVLVAACVACSSTSAFTRTLDQAISGTLRSLWRQTSTTMMLCVIEMAKPVVSSCFVSFSYEIMDQPTKQQAAAGESGCEVETFPSQKSIFFSHADVDSLRTERRFLRFRALFARGCCFTLRGREMIRDILVHRGESSSVFPIAQKDHQAAGAMKVSKPSSNLYSLRERWAAILLVALGFAIQNIALSVAFVFVPTAIALTLVNSTPIWLVVHSVLFTNKPAARIVILGAFVGFVGAIILCATEMSATPSEDSSAKTTANPLIGVFIGGLGGLGGAIYFKAAKHAKGVTPTRLLLFSNAGACVCSFAVSYQTGARGLFDPEHGFLGWIDPANREDCLLLSFVVDCIGSLGILLALRFVDPLIVTVSLQLEPVLASVLDSLVGVGTLSSMNFATFLGSIIVFSGCAIVVSSSSESKDDIDASGALEPVHSQKQR